MAVGSYLGLVLNGTSGSNENAGFSVSGIGDVNGDGFEDVAVAAPRADVTIDVAGTATSYTSAGAVFVVFGTASGLPTSVDLDTLDGTDGFQITPEEGLTLNLYGYSNGRFGYDVVGLGDVNGDGVDDFAIAQRATRENPNSYFGELTDPDDRWDNGLVYVIYGGTGNHAAVESVGDLGGFRIDAEGQVTDVFNAGDVNGDGFNDVGFNTKEIYDSVSNFEIRVFDDLNLNGTYDVGIDTYLTSYLVDYNRGETQGFVVFGTDQTIISDTSIATSGNNGGANATALKPGPAITNTIINSEMLDGSDGFEVDTGSIATPIPYSYGGSYGYGYLYGQRGDTGKLTSLGDVNGDGFSDLASTAIDGGFGGYYYLLRQSDGAGGFTYTFDSYTGGPDFFESTGGAFLIYGQDDTVTPFQPQIDRFGVDVDYTVSGLAIFGDEVLVGVGDVSGNDGFGEVVFSENFFDLNGDGSAFVSGFMLLNGLAGDPFSGTAGSSSRSYNRTDLSTTQGAFFYDSTTQTTFGRTGFEIGKGDTDRKYGAAGIGDVTGDGIADFVIAASVNQTGTSSPGDLGYIISGSATGFSGVIDLSTQAGVYKIVDPHGSTFEDWTDVNSATDVNGDGFNDIIFGSAYENSLDGQAAIIFGGPALLEALDVADGTDDNVLDLSFLGNPAPITATPGNDNLDGTPGNDVISLLAGDDIFRALGGDDVVNGDGGNDTIRGDAGADTILGGADDDQITGGNNDDSLDAGAGADVIFGNGGSDVIAGGTEDDLIYGGAGTDTASGGAGDDEILGQGSADSLSGDAGNDTLRGGSGDDTLSGGEDADQLFGNGNNDGLMGDGGADTLQGAGGLDTLEGGAGADRLTGGTGNDSLDGGTGDDVMNGGAGADRFVFDLGHETDRINGFEQGIDTIELDAMLWSGTGGIVTGQDVVDTFGTSNGTGTILTLSFTGGDVLEIQSGTGITAATLGLDIDIV